MAEPFGMAKAHGVTALRCHWSFDERSSVRRAHFDQRQPNTFSRNSRATAGNGLARVTTRRARKEARKRIDETRDPDVERDAMRPSIGGSAAKS